MRTLPTDGVIFCAKAGSKSKTSAYIRCSASGWKLSDKAVADLDLKEDSRVQVLYSESEGIFLRFCDANEPETLKISNGGWGGVSLNRLCFPVADKLPKTFFFDVPFEVDGAKWYKMLPEVGEADTE